VRTLWSIDIDATDALGSRCSRFRRRCRLRDDSTARPWIATAHPLAVSLQGSCFLLHSRRLFQGMISRDSAAGTECRPNRRGRTALGWGTSALLVAGEAEGAVIGMATLADAILLARKMLDHVISLAQSCVTSRNCSLSCPLTSSRTPPLSLSSSPRATIPVAA
jgi:hypothetical protein